MLRPFNSILPARKSLIIITLVLVIAITFETFQQLFYIRRYNLGEGVTFVDVLRGQSYRWLVWMLLGIFLFKHARRNAGKEELSFKDIMGYVLVILALVFASIIVISFIEMFLYGGFSWSDLINEYLPFFTFQKVPIHLLGYIAVAIILHLYFTKEVLQFEIQRLSEIKKSNETLYHSLRSNIDDKATILNIKVGNKRKIIPIEEISWVEADDYCVRVHTLSGESYSMRSTLKAMEEKLTGNFLRVHRKAIVNMDLARELSMSHPPNLTLSNNIKVPVSKSNLKLVRDYLS